MRKRPIGLIVFFVSLFGFGAYWLFLSVIVRGSTLSPKIIPNVLSIYILIFTAAYVFAGIAVFFFKKWARKLIIGLSLLGILNMAVLIPLIHRDICVTEETSIDQTYTEIESASPKNLSLEDAIALGVQKALTKSFAQMASYLAHFFAGIFEAMGLLYMLLVLFYFRRSKVKNLFG